MDKVCIVFSGLHNLRGDIALNFVNRFNLKSYPDVPNGRYYGDFDPILRKTKEHSMYEDLAHLFSWLSTSKIPYKFSRAYVADTVVDFEIEILRGRVK